LPGVFSRDLSADLAGSAHQCLPGNLISPQAQPVAPLRLCS